MSVLAGLRIAVLDDDEDNVVLLERLLRHGGFGCIDCYTEPNAALEVLASHPPDLLLLDLHMPELDGYAVLGRLKRHISGPTPLPVIVLTADGGVEAKRAALKAGARDFLTKPYDLTEVLLRVGNTLETRYLHGRLAEHNRTLEHDDAARVTGLGRIAAELAHEVRTPLYAIRGLTEVLLDFEDSVPTALRPDIQQIDDVAREALEVVDRQIAGAQLASGQTTLTPGSVRVNELLDRLGRTLRPLVDAQGIELIVEPASVPELHTDPVLVGQVLLNLASNAIQHTHEGEVRISATVCPDGGHVAFRIVDTGIGIHPDDQEQIFAEHGRASASTLPGGTGLPLARRLGGEVTVTSRPGRGSTFIATVAIGARDPDAVPYLV